jgi:CRISPR-associated protein Cas2
MYCVIVYDVGIERLDSIRIFLKQYLNWVQNSVFEGELTRSQYYTVREELTNLINEDHDNILIYKTITQSFLERESLGTIKAEIGNII